MKFEYQYRTRDNARHSGIVFASDRDAAFGKLRKQGVRPSVLVEAPGFFNKLFGKGKRWLAIALLASAVIVAVCIRFGDAHAARYAYEDRSQVFGDPSVLQKLAQDGWRHTFPDVGEAWLACHAIPGKVCGCPKGDAWQRGVADSLMSRRDTYVAINEDDSDELKKMKRIVNGMKREFSAYADDMADAVEYVTRACERTRVEKGVYDTIVREIGNLERQMEKTDSGRESVISVWDKKNSTLRAMGLPTIPLPE